MSIFRNAREALRPGLLLPSLTAGVVIGGIQISVCMSFAVMIFSGRAPASVSAGIGAVLFAGLALNVLISLTSSNPCVTAAPQDGPTAVVAVLAASVAAALGTNMAEEEVARTVIIAMGASTLLTGLMFWGFGRLGAGGLVRFIPYPVIGGFLAGTGWLLFTGSVPVMTGSPLTLGGLGPLFDSDSLLRWAPGLVFGVALFAVKRRTDHYLVLPAMLVAAVALFYAVLLASGYSVARAGAEGWLLQGLPEGILWKPLSPADVFSANWGVVFAQWGNLLTIVVVSLVQFLLYVSGLEISIKSDLELDRELRVAGLANVAAAVGGGLAGYHWPSTSVLAHKMKARSRIVGLTAAALFGLSMVSGSSFLPYFPKMLLGGLLAYLGIAFLAEWVFDSFRKLPYSEYAIVIGILGVIGAVGFLEGVAVGLAGAVALFVIKYSRIPVARASLSGATFRSNRDRPPRDSSVLKSEGEKILIIKLQGFIFFGTANGLLQAIKSRSEEADKPTLKYAILDFRQVSGLDSSALLSFVKLKQYADSMSICLVFTQMSPSFVKSLEKEGFREDESSSFRLFPDLDRGVEWCEDGLLKAAGADARGESSALFEQLVQAFKGGEAAARFMSYMQRLDAEAGHTFIRQGENANEMYFVEVGWVTVALELENSERVRLRTMGPGTVVGEAAFYTGAMRTASVVTDGKAVLWRLPADSLKTMEEKDPGIASSFHTFMVRHLAERLAFANRTLQAVLE